MIRPLRSFPDPILNTPARPVTHFTAQTRRLIQDLQDTLAASPGVGLAAPQIGVSECVAVVDVSRDRRKKPRPGTNHGLIILVNPVIIGSEGLQIPREGCLSVPDFLADVRRAEKVRFRTLGEDGQQRTLDVGGFEALAVQHEVDHLNGTLFLDRVANVKTDLFRRQTSS